MKNSQDVYFIEPKSDFVESLKIVFNAIVWGIILCAIVCYFWGVRPYVVVGWSMQPTIDYKAVVFDKTYSSYKLNDIITYTMSQDGTGSSYITHRIIDIKYKNDNISDGVEYYVTKGDNPNIQESDKANITPNRIKGKVLMNIPFLGYLILIIQQNIGPTIIVIIGMYIFFNYVINKKMNYETSEYVVK
jgi:signal peptidase I